MVGSYYYVNFIWPVLKWAATNHLMTSIPGISLSIQTSLSIYVAGVILTVTAVDLITTIQKPYLEKFF